jgi:hypothetical protein
VVGVLSPEIVLPRWTLALPEPLRLMIVRHEREHVDAADPWLAMLGAAGVLLMPWSPALWWQLRRLRLAVEVDCDARVLRGGADARAYGSALLEVGRHRGRSRLAVAAFSEPASSLERRIHLMTAPRVRHALLRAAAFGAVSAVLLAVACEAPGPLQPSPGGNRRLYAEAGEAQGLPRTKIDLRQAVARWFPDVARDGLGADEYLYFTVSPEGEVVGHERLRSVATAAGGPAASGSGIAVRGREGMAAMERLDLRQVRSIDRLGQPAGAVAPTPVTIVWVEMKGPGEDPGALRMSSHDPATNRVATRKPMRNLDFMDADGLGGSAATVGGATPDQGQLRAAMHRFYTPALKAAGVRGSIELRFTVGADGRTHDVVVVNTAAPELVPVGRAVVESLTYPRGVGGAETRLEMRFELAAERLGEGGAE